MKKFLATLSMVCCTYVATSVNAAPKIIALTPIILSLALNLAI